MSCLPHDSIWIKHPPYHDTCVPVWRSCIVFAIKISQRQSDIFSVLCLECSVFWSITCWWLRMTKVMHLVSQALSLRCCHIKDHTLICCVIVLQMLCGKTITLFSRTFDLLNCAYDYTPPVSNKTKRASQICHWDLSHPRFLSQKSKCRFFA